VSGAYDADNACVAYDAVPSKEPVIPPVTFNVPVTSVSPTILTLNKPLLISISPDVAGLLILFVRTPLIATKVSSVLICPDVLKLPVISNGPFGNTTVPYNVCVSFDASPNWFDPLEYITEAVS
jgi:hypothetical protein